MVTVPEVFGKALCAVRRSFFAHLSRLSYLVRPIQTRCKIGAMRSGFPLLLLLISIALGVALADKNIYETSARYAFHKPALLL